MYRKISVLILILVLSIFVFDVLAITRTYVRSVLTGGVGIALDALDGDLPVPTKHSDPLNDGDKAIVITLENDSNNPLITAHYILDADSGLAETPESPGVVPTVIAPDINPGDKRWLLTVYTSAAIPDLYVLNTGDTIAGNLTIINNNDRALTITSNVDTTGSIGIGANFSRKMDVDGTASPQDMIFSSMDYVSGTLNGSTAPIATFARYVPEDKNSECTAASTPHSCCTGSGTGTCDDVIVQNVFGFSAYGLRIKMTGIDGDFTADLVSGIRIIPLAADQVTAAGSTITIPEVSGMHIYDSSDSGGQTANIDDVTNYAGIWLDDIVNGANATNKDSIVIDGDGTDMSLTFGSFQEIEIYRHATTTDLNIDNATTFVGALANQARAANSVTIGSSIITFEGATGDNVRTSIIPTDPTTTANITLPNKTGTFVIAPGNALLGTTMWGDGANAATDTGDEICTFSALTCKTTYDHDGGFNERACNFDYADDSLDTFQVLCF